MSTTIDNLQIKIETSSQTGAAGIRDLASALGELKKNGSLGTVTKNLKSLSESLNALSSASNSAGKITSLANSLEKLKNIGSVRSIVNSISQIPAAMKALEGISAGSAESKIKSLADAMGSLSGVSAKGFTSAVNSLSKIANVTKALDDDVIDAFTDKVDRLVKALTPLSTKLTTIKTGLSGFTSQAKSAGKAAKDMGDEIDAAAVNFDVLTNNLETVLNVIHNVVNGLVEVTHAASEWDGIATRFGKGFGDQAQETYEWIQRLNEEMGINIQQFMQYSSLYATMLKGFGVASEDASKMALGYTELTYDIWASANDRYKTFQDAADAVASAIAGEVEPIRRAGFTIVEATLEETAAYHGLDVSIANATESQKSYLRYLTLVDQAHATGVIGTYAKELNTAEGLMRTFSQQLKTLAQSFGSLFLPILVRVMPYVSAFVDMLTELIHIIAGLFNIEIQPVDWSGYNEGSVVVDKVADSMDGATKAAKELKNAALGMDELNVISPNTSSPSGGAGGGNDGFSGLDIDSMWDESIFANIKSNVDEIKNKMKEWLGITDDIDTWAELFDTRLGKILITVGSIGAGIAAWKIGTGIATAINAIATLVNLIKGSKFIGWLTAFISLAKEHGIVATFSAAFPKLSAALSAMAPVVLPVIGIIAGLVGFIWGLVDAIKEGVDWLNILSSTLGATLTGTAIGFLVGGPYGAAIGAAIGLAVGLVTNIGLLLAQNWEDIKEWVKNLPQEIEKLGKWLDGLPKEIEKWFKNLAKKIDKWFEKLWQPIKDYDWKGLGTRAGEKLGETARNVVDSVKRFFSKETWDAIKEWSKETGDAIVEFFEKLPGRVKDISASIKEGFLEVGTAIRDGIFEGINAIGTAITDFVTGFIDGFKKAFGIHSPSTVARDELGKNILAGILEALKPDSLVDAFKEMWKRVVSWWNSKTELSTYTPNIGSIKDRLTTAWNTAKTWWDSAKGTLKEYVPSIGSIRDKLSSAWNTAKDWWDKSKAALASYTPSIGDIKAKVVSAWNTARDWWNKSKAALSTYTPSIGSIKNALESAWKTAKDWWNKNVKLSIPSLSFKVTYSTQGLNTAQKAIVKALDLDGWPKLQFAANGGMFNQGSMIWAGERGAEIVANASGGKTGVMNVDQMYQAVYDAVYSAMTSSNSQNSGGGAQSFNLYLDGKQVTSTVEKTQKERGASIFGTEVYSY